MKKNLLFGRSSKYSSLFFTFILTVFTLSNSFAQNRQITGKVLAGDVGGSLPGVSVLIKGTNTGTVTAANGNYSISTPPNATLVFSFIGYARQEIVVGGRSVINLTLAPDANTLKEVNVVSVGYGSVRKKDLTGAVSSVSAEQLEKTPVATLDQALQGRASGVAVTSNDGAPGAGIQVQIRGVGSLGNNDPLYVVDGYPITGGLSNINPSDIASVDILKDASATAIYGNRASNGVVIITTKRGGKNGVQVSLDVLSSIQSKPKQYSVLNAQQWAALATQIAPIDGYTPLPEWSNPSTLRNADWQNAAYRSGLKQEYNLSVRGGSEKSQSAFSAGYYDQKGIVLGSDFKRINLSLNQDFIPFKWLRSSSSLKYSRGNSQVAFGTGGQGAGSGIGYLSKLPPTVTGNKYTDQISDGNGNFGFYNPSNPQVKSWSNPIYSIDTQDQKNLTNYFLGTTSLEATILPGLKIKTNLGLNTSDYSGYYATPTDNRAYTQYNASVASGQNFYSQNANNTFEYLWENTLAYTKTFGPHSIDFVGGVSQQQNTYRQIGASGNNLPSDALRDIGSIPILNKATIYLFTPDNLLLFMWVKYSYKNPCENKNSYKV